MKYMGSKAKIAKYILPYIHSYIMSNNIKLYIEPFIGGANMIDKVQCQRKVGSDIDRHLVALLNHVKNGGALPEDISFDLYKDVRTNRNTGKYQDWFVGAVEFLASFNGRGFTGGYAKPSYETKKDGTKILRNYYQECKRNILKQAENLRNVEIYQGSYEMYSNVRGALIYCDPPYKDTKAYNNSFDHDKFWEWVRQMSNYNMVLVSEETAPADFDIIWQQSIKRTINASDKKISTEKLFIYKGLNNQTLDF